MDELYYHYTSIAAFKNIVESKSLWLTKANFLNDRTEIVNGISFIKEMTDITMQEITHANVNTFF